MPEPTLVAADGRVALRPWGAAATDAAALVQAWQDPEVARWNQVPAEPDDGAAARWIAGEAERRRRGLAVDLVVVEGDAPEAVLGEVGLVLIDRSRRWAEVGYWMAAPARNRGRATAAVSLFSHWALTDLALTRLVARTHPDNPAAARVARAAGYRRVGGLRDRSQLWTLDQPA